MKLRALVAMARSRGVTNPGDTFEADSEEAARMVRAGYAEAITKEAKESVAASIKTLEAGEKETAAKG